MTRRGGDRWRASARGSIGLGSDEGGTDRIDDAGDLGVEAGGPVARGLSFWGAIGHERVRVLRDASGRLDPRTEERSVTSAAARLDWQATPSDRAGVSWTSAFSEHTGLATGDQPDEADSATWVQRDWREDGGPPGLFKIEGHHLFARRRFPDRALRTRRRRPALRPARRPGPRRGQQLPVEPHVRLDPGRAHPPSPARRRARRKLARGGPRRPIRRRLSAA